MSSIREAEERLRYWRSGAATLGIDLSGGNMHEDDRTLADAYLAEHRPDDGEPVTEEWQDSVFGTDDSVCLQWHDEWGEAITWIDTLGTVLIPMPKTRGQVRALFAAIDVPLKETS